MMTDTDTEAQREHSTHVRSLITVVDNFLGALQLAGTTEGENLLRQAYGPLFMVKVGMLLSWELRDQSRVATGDTTHLASSALESVRGMLTRGELGFIIHEQSLGSKATVCLTTNKASNSHYFVIDFSQKSSQAQDVAWREASNQQLGWKRTLP